MISSQITNPKGCEHFLYEDDFTDNDDLFEHSVYCGTRLVRDNKLVLCDNCKNIQKAQAQILLDEKKNSKIKELFNKFDEYSCIKDDKWYLEFKEVVLQELQEEIKVLEEMLR